jgi:hypothetical protein
MSSATSYPLHQTTSISFTQALDLAHLQGAAAAFKAEHGQPPVEATAQPAATTAQKVSALVDRLKQFQIAPPQREKLHDWTFKHLSSFEQLEGAAAVEIALENLGFLYADVMVPALVETGNLEIFECEEQLKELMTPWLQPGETAEMILEVHQQIANLGDKFSVIDEGYEQLDQPLIDGFEALIRESHQNLQWSKESLDGYADSTKRALEELKQQQIDLLDEIRSNNVRLINLDLKVGDTAEMINIADQKLQGLKPQCEEIFNRGVKR